jgi:hypothetical protein
VVGVGCAVSLCEPVGVGSLVEVGSPVEVEVDVELGVGSGVAVSVTAAAPVAAGVSVTAAAGTAARACGATGSGSTSTGGGTTGTSAVVTAPCRGRADSGSARWAGAPVPPADPPGPVPWARPTAAWHSAPRPILERKARTDAEHPRGPPWKLNRRLNGRRIGLRRRRPGKLGQSRKTAQGTSGHQRCHTAWVPQNIHEPREGKPDQDESPGDDGVS